MLNIVSGKGHRLIGNRKGQATLEFALVAILLLGLLFLIMDLGIMLFVNLTMQYAVREGTRYAVTGRSDLSPSGQRASVIQQITNKSLGFYPKYCPDSTNFYFLTGANPTLISGTCSNNPGQNCAKNADCSPGTCNFPNNVGAPQDIIIISVNCSWPVLTPFLKKAFPNGKYSFTVKATMKNEPFPPPGGP